VTSTQQSLRLGLPVWMNHTRGRTQRYASLSGNHETSVAVVGMTFGFLAARLLLERWQGVQSQRPRVIRVRSAALTAMPGRFDRSIVESTAHRPWPMPNAPWLMTQSWNDLLFARWRVDVAEMRRAVPNVFDLDLFDGAAWLGIVPFYMTNVGIRNVPTVPWLSAFPELNVRTYVRVAERPGVYFFSLDAGRRLAVAGARALLNLPYYFAGMTVECRGEVVDYQSERHGQHAADFKAVYETTSRPFLAMPGSVDYFLTERYCLYHHDRRNRPYRLEIHHRPWSLQRARADIRSNTMAAANHLTIGGAPLLLHFARRQDVVAWAPTRLRT
jgi:uncharacterized protein